MREKRHLKGLSTNYLEDDEDEDLDENLSALKTKYGKDIKSKCLQNLIKVLLAYTRQEFVVLYTPNLPLVMVSSDGIYFCNRGVKIAGDQLTIINGCFSVHPAQNERFVVRTQIL